MTQDEGQGRAEAVAREIVDTYNAGFIDQKHNVNRPGLRALITAALRAERIKGMEEAAKLCHEMAIKEGFSNITGTEDEEVSRKSCAWMMDQCAAAIREQARRAGEA